MITWILSNPYTAGAVFYGFLLCGVVLFLRGAADPEREQ